MVEIALQVLQPGHSKGGCAKQLSQVLTGKKYLGGGDKKGSGPKIRGKKRKSVPSPATIQKAKKQKDDENDVDDDEDDDGGQMK